MASIVTELLQGIVASLSPPFGATKAMIENKSPRVDVFIYIRPDEPGANDMDYFVLREHERQSFDLGATDKVWFRSNRGAGLATTKFT